METNDKPANHYVDNQEFYQLMVERKAAVAEAKAHDKPIPRINDDIGKIIYDIANHLSYKSNFINYTYKEEMVSDAIENCIKYIDNFDPDKSQNPFAYYTQICYYAFLRRIAKESRQTEIKSKIIENAGLLAEMSQTDSQDFSSVSMEYEILNFRES